MAQAGKFRTALDVIVNLAILTALVIAGATYYNTRDVEVTRPGLAIPEAAVTLRGALVEGDGPIVLIEYADYDCPFCQRFDRDTKPAIVEQFVESGRLTFAYKQYPLEMLHPGTRAKSIAAVSAGLGLDEEAAEAIVSDHEAEAIAFGITGTPTFMVGVRNGDDTVTVTDVFAGAQPFERFMKAITEAEERHQ